MINEHAYSEAHREADKRALATSPNRPSGELLPLLTGAIDMALRNIGDDDELTTVRATATNAINLALVHIKRVLNAGAVLPKAEKYDAVIFELAALGEAFRIASELLAVEAVSRGELTRRRAAATLDMHENTIARWVKDPDTIRKYDKRVGIPQQMARITNTTTDDIYALLNENHHFEIVFRNLINEIIAA